MGTGDKRPGAGRPKGSKHAITECIRCEVAQSGVETPLEYMLRVMCDPTASDKRRDDMAKAAAPYMHARLESVQHIPWQPKPVEELTDEELMELIMVTAGEEVQQIIGKRDAQGGQKGGHHDTAPC